MIVLKICNRIIEYSFYALFLLVPLALASNTSELFEFNKMWLTYGIALIIAGAWGVKIVRQGRIAIQRTPLDIPILLFLASQVISTFFSWDPYVSFWGYYSRFNGGLLSTLTYIFLYYAFLSNFSVISSPFSVFRSKSIGSSVYQSDKQKTGKQDSDNRELKTDNWISNPTAVTMVKRLLFVSLLSGLVVTLWGLPSHFGYDPTCLLFRGELNVSCWTEDFQPKVRIFSTLGQPAWLAAYLAILLPISIAFALQKTQSNQRTRSISKSEKSDALNIRDSDSLAHRVFRVFWNEQSFYFLLAVLFYLALLYTSSRSGFLAVWISLAFLFITYFWINRKKYILRATRPQSPSDSFGGRAYYILLILGLITFFIGQPFSLLNKFSFDSLKKTILAPKITTTAPLPQSQIPHSGKLGGTDSGKIRAIVWQGAINAWKDYPVFGTGVETFAFAYYKYKPAEHNLTSEWNFLYNKAHNEYLNYLAATGLFGLGTYLLMIGWFIFISIKRISKSEFLISKEIPSTKTQLGQLEIRSIRNLVFALLASYISILITNFFGFSVVITNIYLFMIPAFVFVLAEMIKPLKSQNHHSPRLRSASPNFGGQAITIHQSLLIAVLLFAICYLLFSLIKFWFADTDYAYGQGLDRAGKHVDANSYLRSAYSTRIDEPVFKDALAVNDANAAVDLLSTASKEPRFDTAQTAQLASEFAQEALNLSNEITSKHPTNVVFWKNRVRIFYTLSQADQNYLKSALSAIKKAAVLAPNDASISYNFGVLYGQNDDVKKGIEALEKTIKLKPDYRDAHFALGLFYREEAVDKNGKIIDAVLQEKAANQMQYILDYLSPNDTSAKEALENWKRK